MQVVRELKTKLDMLDHASNKVVETSVDNPLEVLRSFGFKADTVEEVSDILHIILYKYCTRSYCVKNNYRWGLPPYYINNITQSFLSVI